MPGDSSISTLALEFFERADYTGAIAELKFVAQTPLPTEPYRLLVQCEILRDLKQTLDDVANRETYGDSILTLVYTLEDKRSQPWLQEAESEATMRLVDGGLLLAQRLLSRVDYPLARRWLQSLHQALPWNQRVAEEYQACEELVNAVISSNPWVPPDESCNLLYSITEIRKAMDRLTFILKRNPSDTEARHRLREQFQQYRVSRRRLSQRILKLQKHADDAISEGRFRDARDALNDLLFLSRTKESERLSAEDAKQLEDDFPQLDVRGVQAQLKQARDLARAAKEAHKTLVEAEDKIRELDFADAQRLIEQAREMELRGRSLSPEMRAVLIRQRKNELQIGDDLILREAYELRESSLVAHLATLSDAVSEAQQLYEEARWAEDQEDFELALQKLGQLRTGWPECAKAVSTRVEILEAHRKQIEIVGMLLQKAEEDYQNRRFSTAQRALAEVEAILGEFTKEPKSIWRFQAKTEDLQEKVGASIEVWSDYSQARVHLLEGQKQNQLENLQEAQVLLEHVLHYPSCNAVIDAIQEEAKQSMLGILMGTCTAQGNLEEVERRLTTMLALNPDDTSIVSSLQRIQATRDVRDYAKRAAGIYEGIHKKADIWHWVSLISTMTAFLLLVAAVTILLITRPNQPLSYLTPLYTLLHGALSAWFFKKSTEANQRLDAEQKRLWSKLEEFERCQMYQIGAVRGRSEPQVE